jgi:hypothetical protein
VILPRNHRVSHFSRTDENIRPGQALLRQQAVAVAPLPTQSAAGRQAPAGQSEGAIPAARRDSALPTWFWPAAGAVGVLLAFLILAIGTLARDRDGTEIATRRLSQPVAAVVTTAPALPSTENVILPEMPKGAATPLPTAPQVNKPELTGSSGSVQISIQPQHNRATSTP